MVKVKVKMFGKFWEAKGKNLDEVLSTFKIPNAKGISVWQVEQDGVVKEKIVQPSTTFGLFNSHGLNKEVAIKNFKLLFES